MIDSLYILFCNIIVICLYIQILIAAFVIGEGFLCLFLYCINKRQIASYFTFNWFDKYFMKFIYIELIIIFIGFFIAFLAKKGIFANGFLM